MTVWLQIRSGQRMEYHYGHFFDDVIVNGDLSMAFDQLLTVTRKLDTHPQWVPVSWVVWSDMSVTFSFIVSYY